MKRKELEDLLDRLSQDETFTLLDKSIEIRIYDLMINARIKYNQAMNEDLDNIIKGLLEVPSDKIDNLSVGFSAKSTLLNWKEKYGHAPAYIFVLNFDPNNPQHKEHSFGAMSGRSFRPCINRNINDQDIIEDIEKIAYEDNAVIIDKKGLILATNIQLVDVNPSAILGEFSKNSDDHKKFGFVHEVHSRHFSSLGASYHIPGSVVYTLGEAGYIRRFEKGKITFSTVEQEIRAL